MRAFETETSRIRYLTAALALAAACGAPPEPAEPPGADAPPGAEGASTGAAIFAEPAGRAGLAFTHFNGMTGRFSYPEMMGSGVALFDYDGDGDLDVWLVQGNLLSPGDESKALFPPDRPLPATDRLFRNDLEIGSDGSRTLRFTDVTEESGLAATGYGMGAVAADFDGDGWIDVYVTNLGPNQMWRNNGPGPGGRVTFTDVTEESGTGDARWGVTAAVIDADADGRLDLYVGNYVEWSAATEPRCSDELGMPNYCGPLAFEPQPDVLYLNKSTPPSGGIRFEDVAGRAGIRAEYGGALGVAVADFDADGRLDLYVGNDGLPNQLWVGQGDGRFENQALLSGCAVNALGRPEASMGTSAADFDGDGDEDLFITHLDMETNTVYVNDGQGVFEDRSVETGLGSPSFPFTGFGTGWLDYDNDGWLDLVAVNGAVKVIKELALAGDPLPLHQKNQLFHSRGRGADGRVSFEEVSDRAGPAFAASEVSRGAAFGDLDNDGDTDVVISNNSGPARLAVNQVGQDRHWLGLRLVTGRRDAWGASASVTTGTGRRLVRRVGSTASYASSSDPRLLFGLGEETEVTSVRVVWPSGLEEEWSDLEIDRYTTLEEGNGR